MKKSELVREMREYEPELAGLDDAAVLDTWRVCDCCGAERVTLDQLPHVIALAGSLEEFNFLCGKVAEMNAGLLGDDDEEDDFDEEWRDSDEDEPIEDKCPWNPSIN